MKNLSIKFLGSYFSFMLIFSTVSSLIVGGKIKEDSFKTNESIPTYYHHINFNDFGSGFLTCFVLTMVNNMNVVTSALSQPVGVWCKAYFSLYYLLGILVLLNVFQSYVLDMYVCIKKLKIKNKY
jgi:hypothetical protein